ncbi:MULTISPECIES: PRC-barrel domain-containing protein [Methylobacterium]|uniref:PRC-barrel domain protein n=1 Tax=Methylobacterium oryzae CBMB20 TaxID=693986 RepID=A0A088B2C8_9HYPH|nr:MULTISPECIES: PRC-barrel domain-containing protein [Methylobacterium]AGO88365.1 PRC-barrel domain protein [Methylobacterium oryzae CBMB20]WFS05449.1 PRC-barrel domain-containing protein [Methylobacterium sp. 391_Methyba4]
MKNAIISAIAASAMLAMPALAQDKQAAQPANDPAKPMATPPAGTAMPATPNGGAMAAGSGGMTMADTATAKIKFVTAKPADVTSSKLVGKNLYNNKNETVGEIEDLVIDNGKTVTGVIVSVGGFLGMGERYVLVDPSSIVLHRTGGSLKAMVDADKDTIKNAPEFKYDKKNT